MLDYIRWIRGQVGHQRIFLNFAVCAVFDDAGRVLLQRRGDRALTPWGFPGGAVELGESVEEATVREVREETGLTIAVNALIGVHSKYEDSYPNGDRAQTVAVAFRGEVRGGTLRADGVETVGLEFFDPTSLPPLLNRQHEDIAADLRCGAGPVWR